MSLIGTWYAEGGLWLFADGYGGIGDFKAPAVSKLQGPLAGFYAAFTGGASTANLIFSVLAADLKLGEDWRIPVTAELDRYWKDDDTIEGFVLTPSKRLWRLYGSPGKVSILPSSTDNWIDGAGWEILYFLLKEWDGRTLDFECYLRESYARIVRQNRYVSEPITIIRLPD